MELERSLLRARFRAGPASSWSPTRSHVRRRARVLGRVRVGCASRAVSRH